MQLATGPFRFICMPGRARTANETPVSTKSHSSGGVSLCYMDDGVNPMAVLPQGLPALPASTPNFSVPTRFLRGWPTPRHGLILDPAFTRRGLPSSWPRGLRVPQRRMPVGPPLLPPMGEATPDAPAKDEVIKSGACKQLAPSSENFAASSTGRAAPSRYRLLLALAVPVLLLLAVLALTVRSQS